MIDSLSLWCVPEYIVEPEHISDNRDVILFWKSHEEKSVDCLTGLTHVDGLIGATIVSCS